MARCVKRRKGDLNKTNDGAETANDARAEAARQRLILALDVPTLAEAEEWYARMGPYFGWFKVGLELFSAHGPAVFDRIPAERVFLDVKYHDIPNTVGGASRSAAGLDVWMFNVHAAGGAAMMRAARKGADEAAARRGGKAPLVIAVTVLSSIDEATLRDEIGVARAIEEQVTQMALLARDAGLDGVVASAPEVARIRAACGPEFVIMTPGIRPAGAPMGDQKRVMTPAEAIRAGSTYLGIGRAVTAAADPEAAAAAIVAEVAAALSE
jgi:orotidine-5'-phosphate decarboxylase